MEEKKSLIGWISKHLIQLLLGIIGGVIVAYIIQDARFAPMPIGPMPTPASFTVTNTPEPTLPEPEKIDTQVTEGGVRKNYSMTLEDGEILVGHADKFKVFERCVSYLIVGPGEFNFSVESGLWDKWSNVTPDLYDSLLKEQSDTLVNRYSCTPVKIVKCEPECTESEP